MLEASHEGFNTFEDAFVLAFNINLQGIVILGDYLQFLPAMEQQDEIIVYNTYEKRRGSTFGD